MLIDIEELAKEYYPTIVVLLKNIDQLRYYCKEPVNNDSEFDSFLFHPKPPPNTYMAMAMYSSHVIQIRRKDKYVYPDFRGACVLCNRLIMHNLHMFCKECWKTKTREDAHKILDEYLDDCQQLSRKLEKHLSKPMLLPKSITVKSRWSTFQAHLTD